MKKRFFSVLAALTLLTAILTVPAGAQTGGTCGDDLSWSVSEDGTLTVSGTGSMEDYAPESQPWYDQKDSVSAIVIGEGVTTIGSGAFSGLSARSVQFPNTVTSIAYSAFYGCDDMTGVVLPTQLKSIGESAFSGCGSLEEITFRGSAPEIGAASFRNVTAIAYYPGRDTTWTTDVRQQYDGTITWRPEYFVDVARNSYYELPLIWAVEHEIANGMDPTHFMPDMECTRAQVVTFLWRAKGCPEPESTTHPFVDVTPGSYYEKAVIWAAENDIANGIGKNQFAPNQPCTRAQVVTFLWRTLDKPAVDVDGNPFRDVKTGDWFCEPVLWAAEAGVSNGNGSPSLFTPFLTCTRGQIVTFLYRALG